MSASNGKQPPMPQGAWPTETYTTPERKLYFNGEGVLMIHPPAAHTDGDTIVFFRRSDVISTGDIFVTNGYPIVDLSRGGNIQGVIDGLNRIIDLAIPADEQEGGTQIIPGHGRLCDVADVVFYQEMVTIIRDRIQDMVNKGMTLEQVKAAKPTIDYDPRYGKDHGLLDDRYVRRSRVQESKPEEVVRAERRGTDSFSDFWRRLNETHTDCSDDCRRCDVGRRKARTPITRSPRRISWTRKSRWKER